MSPTSNAHDAHDERDERNAAVTANDGGGWWIYRGTGEPHDGIASLPEAPPWRAFGTTAPAPAPAPDDLEGGASGSPNGPDGDPDSAEGGPSGPAGGPNGSGAPDRTAAPPLPPREAGGATARRLGGGRDRRALSYQADEHEVQLVNLALHLRRPLLITGKPGVGKSTLAYAVAHELRLGPVLRWPITSRATLRDGLYAYDAVGRLHDAGLAGGGGSADIGRYLRLGPLGTALLPWRHPRVVLIDEIDKSDLDLPNDLLNVFEEGEFTIPELARLGDTPQTVMTADGTRTERVVGGVVRCAQFPLVVLTSNAEREFPAAFLRRCVRLEIQPPDAERLAAMVAAHLGADGGPDAAARRTDLIAEFLRRRREDGAELANDQLLNALLMAGRGLWDSPAGRAVVEDVLLRPLNEP